VHLHAVHPCILKKNLYALIVTGYQNTLSNFWLW